MREILHFLLVPDAAAARKVRRNIAEHGACLNVIVGTWLDLVMRSRDAFLALEPESGWKDDFDEAAAAMTDAFWAKSFKVDPEGTLSEVRNALIELLRGTGPGSDLPEGNTPGLSKRGQRRYEDLLRLYSKLGKQLPEEIERIRRILDTSKDQQVRPIRVYHVHGIPELLPWQRALLSKLDEGLTDGPDPKLQEILALLLSTPAPLGSKSVLSHLQRSMFSEKAKRIPRDNSLLWLGVRDELEEMEVTAGMIQKLLGRDATLAPDQIGLVLDGGRFRDWAASEVFGRAGLPLSGLRPSGESRNLGGEALFNFLVTRRPGAPLMARLSLVASPLMPWPAQSGWLLAREIIKGNFGSRIEGIHAGKGSEMAALIEREAQTAGELSHQLKSFITNLSGDAALKDHVDIARENAGIVQDLLASSRGGDDIPWREILRMVPQAPLPLPGTEALTREGIAVMYEDEEPWRQVRILFVTGFSEGHYPANPPHYPVFDDADRLALRAAKGIELHVSDEAVIRNRDRFLRQLCSTSEKCIFVTPLRSADGRALSMSGSATFMARLFKGADDPDNLLLRVALEDDQAKVIDLPLAKAEEPSDLRCAAEADLDLQCDLLEDKSGNVRHESPTKLEKMMVSPLCWFLNRLDALPCEWEPEQCDAMTGGNIAHKVFEDLFGAERPLLSDKDIDQSLPAIFSQVLQKLAPFLNREEWSVERKKLEADIAGAAKSWGAILRETGAVVSGTELEIKGNFAGLPIRGRTDLVLALPDGRVFVVDYKKSTSTKRLNAMKNGYDLQASLYREMLKGGETSPIVRLVSKGKAVGILYYLMNSREGLSDEPFGHHEVQYIEANVSENAEREVMERIGEVHKGVIRLNRAGDESRFDKLGVETYCLSESPLIARFTLPEDGEGGEEQP